MIRKPVMVQYANYTSVKNIFLFVDSGFLNGGEGEDVILRILKRITELFLWKNYCIKYCCSSQNIFKS